MGCAVSLALLKETRLSAFENRVLRRMFVPKREEVAGGRITLSDAELLNLYYSENISKAIK
jgi:hypothetical protein